MSNLQAFIKTGNMIIKHDNLLKKEAFIAPLLKTMLSRYATNLGIMSAFGGIGSEDGFVKGFGKSLVDPTTHLMTLGTMAAAPALVKGTGMLGKGLEKVSSQALKPIGRSMQWFSDDKYRMARSEALKRVGAAGEGGKVGNIRGIFSKVDPVKTKEYNSVFDEANKNISKAIKDAPRFSDKAATIKKAGEDLGYGFQKPPSTAAKIFKNEADLKPTFKPYANSFVDNNALNPYSFSLAGTAAAAAGIPVLSAPAQLTNAMYNQELYKGVLNSGDSNRYSQWFTF